MTELRSDAPLKRETALFYRGRALVVTLRPGFLEVRQKGKRKGYTVSYDAIFSLGAKIQAIADRQEKLNRKKGKRQR
jgi:hypothetical protein